jgi:sec-independent protein translocase protein TatC
VPKDTGNSSKNKEMTFWEHTAELANRLKIVLYTLIFSTVLMMILPANLTFINNPFEFYDPLVAVILRKIKEQILPAEFRLIGLEVTSPIELYVVASFLIGLAITAPVFAYEIFRFIDPALYPDERRAAYPFVTSFLVLFIVGIFFGYWLLTPVLMRAMLPFFIAVGAEPIISIMDFYTLVFVTTIMTGAIFTFPVFFILLVRYGIIGTQILTKNRKYLYVALFIITAIVTPDGGPLADIILFIPIVLLVEAGIFFARRYEKKGEIRRLPWFAQETKCKFCGRTMPSDVTFCPNCGRSGK